MVHVRLMFVRMVWIFFGALPCRKKKKLDSSRLDVVDIARAARHASFQPLEQQKTCNPVLELAPLSDTINSVLHREVGRAKDLSASRGITTLVTLPSPHDFTSCTLSIVQPGQSGWLSGANEGFLVTACM